MKISIAINPAYTSTSGELWKKINIVWPVLATMMARVVGFAKIVGDQNSANGAFVELGTVSAESILGMYSA